MKVQAVNKVVSKVLKKPEQLTFKFPKKKPVQRQMTFKFPKTKEVGQKLNIKV